MFTNRQTTGNNTGGTYNRSFGTDLNLRLAQFLFVNSYIALTRTPDTGGEAGRLAVGWRDRVWDASAAVRYVGNDFTPGMGFIRRAAIRQWYGTVGAHPRVSAMGVLEINPYGEADYVTDLNGNVVTWDGALGFGVTFRDGGGLSLRFDDRREVLTEPFIVRSGVTIPIGDYHFREASASYGASEGRAVYGSLGITGGGYFDGSRFSVEGSLSWQPDYHLTLEASAEHNAISVQGTAFSADLYSARIKYAFSTTLYFGVFVQYNADVDQVVTNARVNLIHAPLSDFFLVFTERRDVSVGTVLERFLTAKFTKLLAF